MIFCHWRARKSLHREGEAPEEGKGLPAHLLISIIDRQIRGKRKRGSIFSQFVGPSRREGERKYKPDDGESPRVNGPNPKQEG